MKDDEIRILILEDNPTDAELVEHELRKGGVVFQSKRVETRDDFISQIEEFTPQLILADYKLPTFDGMTAFSIFKEKGLEVPFIIVSGTLGEDLAIEALKTGVTDYVLKNNLHRLVPAVNRALAETELHIQRRQAEEALRERESQFKKLSYHVPGMIYQFMKRPDGTYCLPFATEAIKDIFGCSPQDVREDFSPIARVILPEDFDKVLGSIEYSAKHLTVWECEYRVQIPGQSIRWMLGQSTPEKLADGSIIWYGFNTDITERKKAEEALVKSEKNYRRLHETMRDAFVYVDMSGAIIDFNQSFQSMLGFTKEKLHRLTYQDLTPEKWHAFEEKIVQEQVLLRGYSEIYEKEYRRKDGTFLPIELRTILLRDDGDQPIGMWAIIRDITGRKEAEKALRRSEHEAKRLAHENAAIAEIGRVISSTLDIEEIYDRFASEVKKLIPFDRLDISSTDFQNQMVTIAYVAGQEVSDRHKGDRFSLKGSLSEELDKRRSGLRIQSAEEKEWAKRFPALVGLFSGGIQSLLSIPLLSQDQVIGSFLLESLTSHVYTEEDLRLAAKVGNQIAGVIANARLFAEHEKSEKEKMSLQAQLQQSQKMEAIGRLAGGIAHDFNNLLTVISIQSQLSVLGLREGDPLRENLQEIEKAADRAANLTRQLLAFSRRQILDIKVLNLNYIVSDLEKMLHRIIGEDLELASVLADDLGMVKVDPGQMEQVIVNLAVNAKDAMPQGGKLTIETTNVALDEGYTQTHMGVIPGAYVMLSVSDTGVGMSTEVKEQIFDPFFTTKEKGKGTGLGLSTVYGIVKQSGGDIYVYTEEGYGTTFKIYFPRVFEPGEELAKKEAGGEVPRGTETILVVEDDNMVRRLARDILRAQGYTVLEAEAGGEALLMCGQYKEPIHLILTDVVMPHMSGAQFVERLKQTRKDFKVLYMTGYAENAITHHGLLEKGLNLIPKPFTLEKLARKVREVLDANDQS